MSWVAKKKAHWIGGTATAALGTALVKLLAPVLSGQAETIALAAGYALVPAGLAIMARATRREPADASDMSTSTS